MKENPIQENDEGILIIAGTMLQHLTGGYIPPAIYELDLPETIESTVTFEMYIQPPKELRLDVLRPFRNKEALFKFQPITAGEFLAKQLQSTTLP